MLILFVEPWEFCSSQSSAGLHTVLLRTNLTENAFGTRSERVCKCVPFAFHLRSICVPFAFHSRFICVPFAFHMRSIRVPFAFHLRSICVPSVPICVPLSLERIQERIQERVPVTRSGNARKKIEYHRKISLLLTK